MSIPPAGDGAQPPGPGSPSTPADPVPERRMLEVAGRRLELADIPAGPGGSTLAPVVFLHEGLGSVGLWKGFPERVAAATGRRAVVYSRTGYGSSDPADLPRPVGYMHAEALEVLPELLDRLGVDRPVLVGHSDGASIALVHAGGSGRPVSGLALLAPHVLVEPITLAGIRAARSAYQDGDLRRRLARYHADVDNAFWGWNDVWLSPGFASWNIEELLPAIGVPTLVIQGDDDPYGTLEQVERIRAGVAGPLSAHHLRSCGHAPHLEQGPATFTALHDWLADLGC